MSSISIDQLANEIANAVKFYTEDVSVAISKKVDEVADKVLAEVKSNYPYKDRSGNYTKGWKKTNDDEPGTTRRIIWNKSYYNLVHLLEFGHVKNGGGRARAFPHVRPAYEKYGVPLPDHIKRIIERGGDV
jgi:hypothetical protein